MKSYDACPHAPAIHTEARVPPAVRGEVNCVDIDRSLQQG